MGLTDDRNDPCLRQIDPQTGMQKCYLVLSDEERTKGFVRPVRRSYVHVGPPGPVYPLRDLTDDERALWHDTYVKYEEYPQDGSHGNARGSLWTQARLDAVGKGCGTVTTMAVPLAETYARNPDFYGGTYCVGCHTHLKVGEQGEFVWDGTDERVGT